VKNFYSEFKRQEYHGLYPTVDKSENLAGRLNLVLGMLGSRRNSFRWQRPRGWDGCVFYEPVTFVNEELK
jgi:hypothetical protein